MKNEVSAATLKKDDHHPIETSMFGFTDDESVRPITLDELKQSIRVSGKFGKVLASRPIQSWELMALIMQLMEEYQLNYTQDIIYVQRKNSHIMINEEEKNMGFTKEACPIHRWLFDKLLTKWTIPFVSDSLDKVGIAMGFNDDGIELAFGIDINICSNFNIMGGNIMRTYTYGGTPAATFDYIKLKLADWFANFQQMVHVETSIMNAMKEFTIGNPSIIKQVIGELYVKAINHAYGSKVIAPFDTHGISMMVQSYISQRNPTVISNAWDLYNWGTNIMKPGTVDLADINNCSEMFAKFVLEDIMSVTRESFNTPEETE